MTRYLLRLSWPDKRLSSNARGHWRKRSEATFDARREGWAVAKQMGVPCLPNARLVVAFYPPDARRRDIQNMPAMMKAAIDGIADAMGCDDNGFRVAWPETFEGPVKGGAVLIEVQE